jgi:hypothetical protein
VHADAIAILTDIERRCDTARLTYGGVSYWPLCRQKIWAALMQRTVLAAKDKDAAAVSNAGPSWSDAAQTINVVPVGAPQLGLIHPDQATANRAVAAGALKPKALFLVRPEEYFDTVNGARFAKTIDSVAERAAGRSPIAKIELADPRTIAFARTLPSLFLQLDKAAEGVRFDPPHKLENYAALAEALAASDCGVALDQATLAADMGKIFYFARIFEKVLTLLAPQVLFQSVYYHPVGMAWLLAARWCGITSVDLQHGRLGPHHGLYTDFTAAPPDGYDLVPDMVWCWGRQTKHDIEVAKNPACRRHNGLIGGNAWLARWRSQPDIATPELAAFDKLSTGRRRILVSLQPLEAPLTPVLLKAMQDSPPDWLWLLRLHPLRRHTAPEIAAILQRANIRNAEIRHATDLPLFPLLKRVDHHVTIFSSVAVEAAAFDVRTSLAGDEGLAIYGPQLARGIFRHTPTAATLLAHTAECLAAPRTPLDDDFMDARMETVDTALAQLMGP